MTDGIMKTVAYGFVTGAGVLTAGRGATVTRNALGEYYVRTSDDRVYDINESVVHAIAYRSSSIPQFDGGSIPEPDQTKIITFKNNAGANVDTEFFFEIRALLIL